ncbi:PilZ domain-containing protein [Hyphomonas sp.]|uniref:PilZ domain-containing protein n=1 Tax=Hyphomonas sp. TaxID=87 RepID=UPI0025B86CE6|nr:PilZ domain-containing protein [Hyphomonas sp.]
MTHDSSPPKSTPPSQRRAAARRRTLRRGRILLNLRHSTVDVMVRDLSATGAQLKLPGLWDVPTDFDLQILAPCGGEELIVSCEKRWQTGVLIGARFVRPPRK